MLHKFTMSAEAALYTSLILLEICRQNILFWYYIDPLYNDDNFTH